MVRPGIKIEIINNPQGLSSAINYNYPRYIISFVYKSKYSVVRAVWNR